MADFKIKTTVWLHHRPFKPGQEDALQEAGFSNDQKAEQARRGAIAWNEPELPEVTVTVDGEDIPGTVEEVRPLEEMTVPELRDLAADYHIDLAGRRRKTEIIEAIREA